MVDNPFSQEASLSAHNIAHELRVLTRTLYVHMKDQAEAPSIEGQDLVVEAATQLFVLAGRIRGHMVHVRDQMKGHTDVHH